MQGLLNSELAAKTQELHQKMEAKQQELVQAQVRMASVEVVEEQCRSAQAKASEFAALNKSMKVRAVREPSESRQRA